MLKTTVYRDFCKQGPALKIVEVEGPHQQLRTPLMLCWFRNFFNWHMIKPQLKSRRTNTVYSDGLVTRKVTSVYTLGFSFEYQDNFYELIMRSLIKCAADINSAFSLRRSLPPVIPDVYASAEVLEMTSETWPLSISEIQKLDRLCMAYFFVPAYVVYPWFIKP